MEYFTLSNGVNMPVLGSGCNSFGRSDGRWQSEPDGDYRPLVSAIKVGYRYFDTAIDYHNEAAIGLFISESGIHREEFFLSTKIPERPEYIASKDSVRMHITRSLERLRTDYLDLLLIHRPSEDVEGIIRTWETMSVMMAEGKIRAIGVSNFEIPLLKTVMDVSKTKPMVNQVMINPGMWHTEVVEFCLKNDIRPTAWGPLTNVSENNKNDLRKIGVKYNKSWAQVLLRHYFQRGIVSVPKSHFVNEQKENLEIFDFKLTDDEMDTIGALRGEQIPFKL